MIQNLHETCIKTQIMSLKFISRVYEKIGTNDEERSFVKAAFFYKKPSHQKVLVYCLQISVRLDKKINKVSL
jgi:hypothetical protein